MLEIKIQVTKIKKIIKYLYDQLGDTKIRGLLLLLILILNFLILNKQNYFDSTCYFDSEKIVEKLDEIKSAVYNHS